MYHTRSPQDASPEMIGSALSVLWMVSVWFRLKVRALIIVKMKLNWVSF
jgi:hypothetical protein